MRTDAPPRVGGDVPAERHDSPRLLVAAPISSSVEVLPVPAPATSAKSRPEANTSRAACCSAVGSLALAAAFTKCGVTCRLWPEDVARRRLPAHVPWSADGFFPLPAGDRRIGAYPGEGLCKRMPSPVVPAAVACDWSGGRAAPWSRRYGAKWH